MEEGLSAAALRCCPGVGEAKMRSVLVAAVLMTALAVPGAFAAAPVPAGAVLQLVGVDHALQDRTLIVAGWVRNAGVLPVSRLVIDASGYAPQGDLAAFGGDGIPWVIRPGGTERFQILLPLSSALVSRYTVGVSDSRPRQTRPVSITRGIFPAFYRPLILPRVHVKVDAEPTALTFTASVDDLPVEEVHVTVNFFVQEEKGPVLTVLTVQVPVGRPLRVRFAPLIINVVSVTVTDIILTPSWTVP